MECGDKYEVSQEPTARGAERKTLLSSVQVVHNWLMGSLSSLFLGTFSPSSSPSRLVLDRVQDPLHSLHPTRVLRHLPRCTMMKGGVNSSTYPSPRSLYE